MVTRKLGYRFLWIDSLCIIQDSVEDWRDQCSEMDNIYRNCAVTLVAASAGDINYGFLQERKRIHSRPYLWEYAEPRSNIPQQMALRQARYMTHNDGHNPNYHDSELNIMEAEKELPIEQRASFLVETSIWGHTGCTGNVMPTADLKIARFQSGC